MRDITKPVSSLSTSEPRNPATVDSVKVKADRFRAEVARQPLEQMFPTSGFKAAFKRKRR